MIAISAAENNRQDGISPAADAGWRRRMILTGNSGARKRA
jgi:hypothetical protein